MHHYSKISLIDFHWNNFFGHMMYAIITVMQAINIPHMTVTIMSCCNLLPVNIVKGNVLVINPSNQSVTSFDLKMKDQRITGITGIHLTSGAKANTTTRWILTKWSEDILDVVVRPKAEDQLTDQTKLLKSYKIYLYDRMFERIPMSLRLSPITISNPSDPEGSVVAHSGCPCRCLSAYSYY